MAQPPPRALKAAATSKDQAEDKLTPKSGVRYYVTAEVAQRYRTAESTVRYWRHISYGPKGARVGRRILYAESDLEKFDAEIASAADEQNGPRGAA